ncbi:MAG: serine/threonine-protein kinase, partial [Chloroflexota bacterium]
MRKNIRGYEIQRQLAAGGFSEVYVARQEMVNREVAIKVILPVHSNTAEFIRRFQYEAELIARLEHPHIVPLYDYWRDPQGAYLVMRYIRGGNLANKLTTDGAMPPKQAAQLLTQIASALAVAHRNRVVHQDIKPMNIMLDEDGNAYLTDFGIARDIEGNVNLAEDESNTMHGSPKYISPEHLRRRDVTPRSDIYSLGILMWEVLTGKPPFEHDDILKLLQMHVRNDLPLLEEFDPALPEQLNFPLRQATLKDPMQRYEHVMDFARDFNAIVTALDSDSTGTIPIPQLSDEDVEPTGPIEVINPYKGLSAFKESDAENFFGRSELIKRLMKAMTDTSAAGRFLAVVGPSGSGKSSVVRAGLIPALRRGEIMGLPTQYISSMIPGANPMRSLEGAILKVALKADVKLIETISKDEYDLNAVLQSSLPEDGEMLLVIDQFEEIFTLVADEGRRRTFLNMIYDALMTEDSRLRVIVTMRADFFDRPLQYSGWGSLFQDRLEPVPVMNDDELREAIEMPAENAGLDLQDGLSDVMINEISDQIGALPLLQYALTELYDRREGIMMTRKAYTKMKGIRGALTQRANEIYDTLDDKTKDVARLVFTRLVRVGIATGNDTRRRVLRGDLDSLDRNPQEIQTVLDVFGKYRLLTFDTDPESRQPVVEVAHEAIIREWGLLRTWLSES